jgi:glycosyltransferase involved in cell wall biosynthesis
MLPVISTVACGASLHLVQDGHNGCLIAPESVEDLAYAMLKISSLSNDELSAYRSASFDLSKQYSTQRWAKTVCSFSSAFKNLRNKNV